MKKSDTQAAIQALINTSTPFIICECRGTMAETIGYIDKKTQQKTAFSRVINLCEANGDGAKQFKVSSRVDEGLTVLDGRLYKNGTQEVVPFPAKKGDQLLVVVGGIQEKMGNTTIEAKQIIIIQG